MERTRVQTSPAVVEEKWEVHCGLRFLNRRGNVTTTIAFGCSGLTAMLVKRDRQNSGTGRTRVYIDKL